MSDSRQQPCRSLNYATKWVRLQPAFPESGISSRAEARENGARMTDRQMSLAQLGWQSPKRLPPESASKASCSTDFRAPRRSPVVVKTFIKPALKISDLRQNHFRLRKSASASLCPAIPQEGGHRRKESEVRQELASRSASLHRRLRFWDKLQQARLRVASAVAICARQRPQSKCSCAKGPLHGSRWREEAQVETGAAGACLPAQCSRTHDPDTTRPSSR